MRNPCIWALAVSATASAQGTITQTQTETQTLTQTASTLSINPAHVSTLSINPAHVSTLSVQTASSGFASNSLNDTKITASLSAAQTTISLFSACKSSQQECSVHSYTYYGGIMSANPTATVITIDCTVGRNQTVCASTPVTVTQGPSLYQRERTSGISGTVSLSCAINGSSAQAQAVCVEAVRTSATAGSGVLLGTGTGSVGFAANSANGTAAALATSTVTFGPGAIYYNQLVLTSGVDKLVSPTSNTPMPPICKGTPSSC